MVRAPQFNGKGKKRGKMRFASGLAVNDSQAQATPWLEGRAGFVRRDIAPTSQGWLKRDDYRRSYAYQPSKHGSLPRVAVGSGNRLRLDAEKTMWARPQQKKP